MKTVGPCASPIHPTTNWWRMRRHKSFIAFDHWPSPLVLERIVKSFTIPPSQCGSNDSNLWPGSDTTCWTVCLTDPSNDQLVKDEGGTNLLWHSIADQAHWYWSKLWNPSQLFSPYFCHRAKPLPFLFNPLSYKYLLIWA